MTTTRPVLIEVAGVAGSGKSTLVNTLVLSETELSRADFISARSPAHLVRVGRSLPALGPVLVAALLRRPRAGWRELKLMVYVNEWHRVLGRETSGSAVLIDQGPIYALVRLKALELGVCSSPRFQRWWDRSLDTWRASLDLVVWLDASDEVLFERIGARDQPHVLKATDPATSSEFMVRYRSLFTAALDRIRATDGPELARFDTADISPAALAEVVEAEIATLRSMIDR